MLKRLPDAAWIAVMRAAKVKPEGAWILLKGGIATSYAWGYDGPLPPAPNRQYPVHRRRH